MSDLPAISSTVHVVRHGEVENPHSILYGRQPGWKLSERGQEMARAVAEWSKELSLGAIHASPLERAQQLRYRFQPITILRSQLMSD